MPVLCKTNQVQYLTLTPILESLMTINFWASSHGTSGEQYFILAQLLGIELNLPFTLNAPIYIRSQVI